MPRYYCDYCDTYLTHDSQAGRRQHNRGKIHRQNVKQHYEPFVLAQEQNYRQQHPAGPGGGPPPMVWGGAPLGAPPPMGMAGQRMVHPHGPPGGLMHLPQHAQPLLPAPPLLPQQQQQQQQPPAHPGMPMPPRGPPPMLPPAAGVSMPSVVPPPMPSVVPPPLMPKCEPCPLGKDVGVIGRPPPAPL